MQISPGGNRRARDRRRPARHVPVALGDVIEDHIGSRRLRLSAMPAVLCWVAWQGRSHATAGLCLIGTHGRGYPEEARILATAAGPRATPEGWIAPTPRWVHTPRGKGAITGGGRPATAACRRGIHGVEARRRALRAVVLAGACLAIFAALAASASAKVLTHGQFIHVTRHLNANQSNNWFGYNQGTLEQGSEAVQLDHGRLDGAHGQPAHRRPGRVLVRLDRDRRRLRRRGLHAHRQHADPDRHRAGRVLRDGQPATPPGTSSSRCRRSRSPSLTVSPGDHMHASISEIVAGSDVWNITITDVTKNQTFTTTVPYPSTHLRGRVDRGDATRLRHRRRRPGLPAEPDEPALRQRDDQRRTRRAEVLRADPADRLERERDRQPSAPTRTPTASAPAPGRSAARRPAAAPRKQ